MDRIENDQQALDMILRLVSDTEPDRKLALGATATIWRLYEKGHTELALAVLGTYNPEAN
mgnify:CR=1 FL=1|jgi:hypothetical protein